MHNTKRNIVDLRLISLYHFILYCQLLFYILFYSFCFYPADSTLCALSLYKASALLLGSAQNILSILILSSIHP